MKKLFILFMLFCLAISAQEIMDRDNSVCFAAKHYINQGSGDNVKYDLILKNGNKISIQKIGCGLCSLAMGAEIQFGKDLSPHSKLHAFAQWAIDKGYLTIHGMGYDAINSVWKTIKNNARSDSKVEYIVLSTDKDNRGETDYVKTKLSQKIPVIAHRPGHYYLLCGIAIKDNITYLYVQDPGARNKSNKWTKASEIFGECNKYFILSK